MATSTLLLPARVLLTQKQHNPTPFLSNHSFITLKNPSNTRLSFKVQAAKLPPGVVVPKVEPKFDPPFLGFTVVAETWNSRVCMIGLVGIFIVESILGKGILQIIGVEVGKGLNIPL